VNTTAATITGNPRPYEKSFINPFATKTQKMDTGAMMRNMVTNKDLASGPNINLP
jgi:hypothetical protein